MATDTFQGSTNQGSAKIIPFPVRARRAADGNRTPAMPEIRRFETRAASNTVAVGGAWYHDAAIQDAKLARER